MPSFLRKQRLARVFVASLLGVSSAAAASPFALMVPQSLVAGEHGGARDTAPAVGLSADGAAALLLVVTSDVAPSSASISVTNEATVVPYDSAYSTYAPKAGKTALNVSSKDIVDLGSNMYILALLQAPDILKPGLDGGMPMEGQPVVATIDIPNLGTGQAQVMLYPPAVLLVHGLWGSSSSLASVQSYLNGMAPFSGLPADFLTPIQYEGDAAFDSSGVQSVVSSAISKIISDLAADEIAVGRVDVVAHSMGGLVARSFSASSNYAAAPSRTLGAFHQIVTIDTPETGSLLADFLVNNANTGFSESASFLAKKVKKAACKSATTVQACFASQGENLAPPGQLISAGAVYSLEPGSPDIAGLPSANIARAKWHALGATVNQSHSIMGANALVFELDELIASTCPGASYCATNSTPPPTVGGILGSDLNDAIVTKASQTAAAQGPVVLSGLAHTMPADAGSLSHWLLSYANVLDNSAVNGQVGCWLTNTACSNANIETQAAWNPAAPWPGFDPTRPWHDVDRLSNKVPERAAMGSPFRVRVRFPARRVASVTVRQRDAFHTPLPAFKVPVETAPDGQAFAVITPLLQGSVHFDLRADFTDYASSAEEFTVEVGPPEVAPAGFWADDLLQRFGHGMILRLHTGETSLLQPGVTFASAPGQRVWLKGGVAYVQHDDGGAPVAEVDQQGRVTALRPGTATIDVVLGKFRTSVEVRVTGQ